MIKFRKDEELTEKIQDIVSKLKFTHVDMGRVICIRSKGSKAKQTIARCYALSKIWQLALGIKAHYVIEVISEKFDKLSKDEKEKIMIHELMHIPFSMGGGFKHHKNWVTRKNVEALHEKYKQFNRL